MKLLCFGSAGGDSNSSYLSTGFSETHFSLLYVLCVCLFLFGRGCGKSQLVINFCDGQGRELKKSLSFGRAGDQHVIIFWEGCEG